MPNYTIKCWDYNSFDFDCVPFVRDAMAAKKYAFAADYVRLFALYTEGGIYLDSDVLVRRPFDKFLLNEFFCGTEAFFVDSEIHYRMEAAIMGAEKKHPFLRECMQYYEHNQFVKEDGEFDKKNQVMPEIISKYAKKYGYKYENSEQVLNGIKVYPTCVFTNTLHPDATNEEAVYAVHQNAGSWIDYSKRGWLFRFCKKHDLMKLYHRIETMIK